MNVAHEFEDADTGAELTLMPDLQYIVAETWVNYFPGGWTDLEPNSSDRRPLIVFTHRIRLARHQFEILEGEPQDLRRIKVIDLEATPDDLSALEGGEGEEPTP